MHSVRSCKPSDARKRYVLFFFSMLLAAPCLAEDSLPSYLEQESVPATKYHLTARPWQPLGAAHYLDIVEDVARFWAAHEDPHLPGRIVDPVPYDSWLQTAGVPQVEMGSIPLAIGVLLKAGRGGDLRDFAIRVMDYETQWYYEHTVQHGALEWGSFVQFQLSAFEVLDALASIPQAKKSQWRNRLYRTNSQLGAQLAQDGSMNSYCYRMLAEWDRYRLGLAFDRSTIVKAIEGTWRSDYPVVRNLIVPMRWNLFSDVRPAPLSLSTEAAGRVPLLLLVDASGYDGPSAGEIRAAVERGTHTMLFLQNPVGEGPPNGRTDNHLWVDAGNAAAMEVMAERTVRRGNSWLASSGARPCSR